MTRSNLARHDPLSDTAARWIVFNHEIHEIHERTLAPEARQKVARGETVGLKTKGDPSSGRNDRNRSGSFAPFRGFVHLDFKPTAHILVITHTFLDLNKFCFLGLQYA